MEINSVKENVFIPEKPLSWSKRNGFPDWLIAVIWLILAFGIFQLVANTIAMGLIFAKEGVTLNPSELMNLITKNIRLVFIGNSIGQVGVLACLTLVFAKISVLKAERNEFFSFSKGVNLKATVLWSFSLIIVIQPAIWFMGWLNQLIPFTESYLSFEAQQTEILINFLKDEKSLLFILINVALVPAFCEEILFRGFLYKLFSKSSGAIWGIVISGVLFGLYHIKLTQAIPLSLIGILLAWMTWKSGSLIPAIVAHFVNNGGSVIAAYYYPEYAFALSEDFLPPFYVTLLSLILTVACLILFSKSTQIGGKNVQQSET